ncbi:MAG: putative ABC-type sugar transport system, periplasmic component [Solirubrobacterales bacterium]|nr:putative ABC-type sugar transport system, periplasmic component [Solirubrobacterales bacterium]
MIDAPPWRALTSSWTLRAASAALLAATLLLGAQGASAEPLVINANTSNPGPRAAWEAAIVAFQAEHPEIDVSFNVYDHESYKKSIRNWLTSASPDVVYWFVGNRMKQFVVPGLLEDVSDLFTPEVRQQMSAAALELVTVGGRQYGVPYTYYHIGVYYRRDLFEQAGVDEPPASWGELLEACDRLKAQGIDPIAIGSKDLWPAAGWFDYLDLRLNGYDFHMDLMSGRVPYTDPRVRAVFAAWRELLDRGCFVDHHVGMTWQESQALLYRGTAAMMLIGNFITPNFPPEVRDRMEFFRFPEITPGLGRYEEAPMNSVHIPARARNKLAARKFLAFVARPDVQESINYALLQIPVAREAKVADDRFLAAGQQLLDRADALTQFFDRDTSEDLATLAMKGFQEFMVEPDRLDDILGRIERARQRVYGS